MQEITQNEQLIPPIVIVCIELGDDTRQMGTNQQRASADKLMPSSYQNFTT